jgi:hypothetical protein
MISLTRSLRPRSLLLCSSLGVTIRTSTAIEEHLFAFKSCRISCSHRENVPKWTEALLLALQEGSRFRQRKIAAGNLKQRMENGSEGLLAIGNIVDS